MAPSHEGEGRRAYRSPLRREQADATKERLIDAAFAEAREGGAGDLSLAKIARRAGVAVPTVYRHFPTRRALLEAFHARAIAMVPPPPRDPDILQSLRSFYVWREQFNEVMGSFGTPSFVWELRREVTVPARRAFAQQVIEREAPGFAEPQRTWLADLLIVLVSDAMVTSFRGYLGLGAADASKRAVWALEALFARARVEAETKRRAGPRGGPKPEKVEPTRAKANAKRKAEPATKTRKKRGGGE